MVQVSFGRAPCSRCPARGPGAPRGVSRRPWRHGSRMPDPLSDRSHWREFNNSQACCLSTAQRIASRLRVQVKRQQRTNNMLQMKLEHLGGRRKQQQEKMEELGGDRALSLADMHLLMGNTFMETHWRQLDGSLLGEEILSHGFQSQPATGSPFSAFEDKVTLALHYQGADHKHIGLFLRRSPDSVMARLEEFSEVGRLPFCGPLSLSRQRGQTLSVWIGQECFEISESQETGHDELESGEDENEDTDSSVSLSMEFDCK